MAQLALAVQMMTLRDKLTKVITFRSKLGAQPSSPLLINSMSLTITTSRNTKDMKTINMQINNTKPKPMVTLLFYLKTKGCQQFRSKIVAWQLISVLIQPLTRLKTRPNKTSMLMRKRKRGRQSRRPIKRKLLCQLPCLKSRRLKFLLHQIFLKLLGSHRFHLRPHLFLNHRLPRME